MNLKKYLISFLYFLVPFLTLLFLATILYYFDMLSTATMKYVKFIIVLLSVFLGGLKMGRESDKKGYQKGLIIGSIIVFFFFFISLISKNLKTTSFLYYLVLLITSTIGSMIGILKKK